VILEINPKDPLVMEGMAEEFIKVGDYAQGREWAERALGEEQDEVRQCVTRLLVLLSYLRHGHNPMPSHSSKI
jgi:hypothetical protein